MKAIEIKQNQLDETFIAKNSNSDEKNECM